MLVFVDDSFLFLLILPNSNQTARKPRGCASCSSITGGVQVAVAVPGGRGAVLVVPCPVRYDDSADSVFRIFWFAAFSDKIRKTAPTRPTQEETLFLHVWNAGLSWISGYINLFSTYYRYIQLHQSKSDETGCHLKI